MIPEEQNEYNEALPPQPQKKPALRPEDAAEEKAHRRHVVVWKILRPIFRLITFFRYRFRSAEQYDIPGPFLLLSTHNTEWDPILVGCSFKEQIYFVSSEHILRHGLGGRLLCWLQDPIGRQKGGSAADTVMTMMRRLKKGRNVCLFPEGNRSWDGVTMDFLTSTAKLARSSGVKLVTYRLDGAYFASPRWAGASVRRGRVRGHVVNIYSPEQLKAMKPAEVNEAIRRDLYEDAYETQRKNPIVYEGTKLAEKMETLFFLCPKCGRVHTLVSKDDRLSCTGCGFSVTYLPTGFLRGEDLPWDNIRDWNRWQTEEIHRLCDAAGQDPVFDDTGMQTLTVETGRRAVKLAEGNLRLFHDRLELPGVTLPLSDIIGISLRGQQDMYIGTKEQNYLVRSDHVRCTLKYLTACSYLNHTSYGV